LADGAGESIWHRFAHTPDKVMGGDTGDIACDHYRRYKDDVALMKRLGLNAYRFSTAWPRILPEGRGRVNQAGIDFYSSLVDELLTAGIKPCLTLYHWDLPQALQDAGGWANPDCALWFRDYAALVYRALGDRVKFWITLNEPFVIAFIGHGIGLHAPGIMDIEMMFAVGHTLLRAHGLAVQAFRQAGGGGEIGITLDLEMTMPASDSPEDKAAANRYGAFCNRWFLDPVVYGKYPEELLAAFPGIPPLDAADAKLISQPLDFMGVNNYTRSIWQHNDLGFMQAQQIFPDAKYTEMSWEVYPNGLYLLLKWLKEDYRNPTLYVTENGAAFPDRPGRGGSVQDDDRLEYVRDYLKACHHAISEGVNLRGYFLWTLLDNFEWAFGFIKRFGIVRVNFETQKRTLKKSGKWYSQVIKNNGFSD
jgi:beta-glucosidase